MSTQLAELMKQLKPHGAPVRGSEVRHSSHTFEGRFGRIFRTLPGAHFTEADLLALGRIAADQAPGMTAEPEDEVTSEFEEDAEENFAIPSGYTYLGQFIDHDLTFDPLSSLDRQNDPDALTDFRTPRFDLDSVYGRGKDDQPYMYESNSLKMLLGRPLTGNTADPKSRDLQRNGEGRAIIGDPRNDENVIVSQLQAHLIRFHNRMVDFMSRGGIHPRFEDVQQAVRWHYQWVVLHDFLPTIIERKTLEKIAPHIYKGTTVLEDPPYLKYYSPKEESFIPIEFAAGAYRFGHSMVRPVYRLNLTLEKRQQIFFAEPVDAKQVDGNLSGFKPFPSTWAIDWNLFFSPDGRPATALGKDRVQASYKIDTSLVNPLGHLPREVVSFMPALAQRNLLRGRSMSLPSGQAVANRLGETPIPDEFLKIGKATKEDDPTNPTLVSLSPRFHRNAPLWYYVLAEGYVKAMRGETNQLGPVGGRIVGETIVGLLMYDKHSFLNLCPRWKPYSEFLSAGQFRMADLLREARND